MATLEISSIFPEVEEAERAALEVSPVSRAIVYADSEAVCRLLGEWLLDVVAAVNTFRSLHDRQARSAALDTSAETIFLFASADDLLVLKRSGKSGGCIGCLESRRLAFKSYAEIIAARERKPYDVPAAAHYTRFTHDLLTGLLTALRDIVAADGPSHGYCIRLRTLEILPFVLGRASGCSVCGGIAVEPHFAELALSSEAIKCGKETYRTRSLSDLKIDLADAVNPVCGMLGSSVRSNRLGAFHAEITGAFIDPNALRVPVMWTGHKSSYDQSLTVGVLEALERHAGLYPHRSKPLTASFAEIRDRALDPRACGLYEDSTYAGDEGLLKFTEDLELQWVSGYSLTDGKEILVPSQFAYYGTPDIILGNSSGCATGSCIEEAIFYALMELIERDAFLLHWYARLTPRRIAVDSLRCMETLFMVERARRAGFNVHILDTRLDLQVPSAVAILIRGDDDLGAFSLSSAASFSPEEAIQSALCEVATHVHWFKGRVLDKERTKNLRLAVNDYTMVGNMEEHALLYGYPEAKALAQFLLDDTKEHSFDESYCDWLRMRPHTRSLKADIEYCIQLFGKAGLDQVIIVDQTSPEEERIGIRTVRAIVRGLLPLDFGWGHCRSVSLPRTYSVPAKMGRRDAALTPAELYRAPHPFQ
jgi:ribosomal protein S12 methylthiotransferase accessory factor